MIRFTEDNTQDNEFRVLRPKETTESQPAAGSSQRGKVRAAAWIVAGLFVILGLVAGGILLLHSKAEEEPEYLYEPVERDVVKPETGEATISADLDTVETAYTEHITRTVNDIVLEIYIPHGAHAGLAVGTPDINDRSIIFATQAADIRADNGKIVGAFVLNGEPLAWGLSKKGYCAIIDDEITIGTAENSPLFEKATETGGCFFRQYPLVADGIPQENTPKGKSIRKSICSRNGEVMVIMTASTESFHDFSQALADFGVDNAIYLVGSEFSYGFYRDGDGEPTQFALKSRGGQRYENYIIWRTR